MLNMKLLLDDAFLEKFDAQQNSYACVMPTLTARLDSEIGVTPLRSGCQFPNEGTSLMNNRSDDVDVVGDHLEEDEQCSMCGGTGGWPRLGEWVKCKPCNGSGKSTELGRGRNTHERPH